MGMLLDSLSQDQSGTASNYDPNSSLPLIPEVPSYLIGADNHQLGATGSSILDPSTWGDRIDHGFKFSVSALTRAVASTFNGAVAIGELAGVADKTDRVSTHDWLQGMDDDLARYYDKNQDSINVVGDVVGMFAPGLGGIKVLNWAQKGVAAATEGRAGLNIAAHFGTLPTKQAQFASLAAADMANTGNTFSLINANLAKSLVAGYAQNALEFAAFDTAAALYMKDSPLFKDHDMGDIAYNALLGGGFIGAGIMGTATAARTVMDIKKASGEIDKATHAWRTVLTEPEKGTSAAENLAIRAQNIEAIPTIAKDDPLYVQKLKGANETRLAELDAGRMAAHSLAGSDAELGNTFFDHIVGATGDDVAHTTAGAVRISRAGLATKEEKELGDAAGVSYIKFFGNDAGTIYDAPTTLRIADTVKNEAETMAVVSSYRHAQKQEWSITKAMGDVNAVEARYIHALENTFNPEITVGTHDIPYLEKAYMEMTAGNITTVSLRDGTILDKSSLYHYLDDIKGQEALKIQAINELAVGEKVLSTEDIAKLVNVSPSLLRGERNIANPASDIFATQMEAQKYTEEQIAKGNWRADKGVIKTYLRPQFAKMVYDTSRAEEITGHVINGMTAIKEEQALLRQHALNTTNAYLGKDATLIPDHIPGHLMVGANRESVGGGLFTSQNGNYDTLASFAQQIGASVAGILQKKASNVEETFATAGHKLLNDEAAGTEFWKITQQLRQTPEKYTLVQEYGGVKTPHLVNMKQLAYEAEVRTALASGGDVSKIAKPVFEDTTAPTHIKIETDGAQQFTKEWDTYHRGHREQVTNLRASQGLTTQASLQDAFYIPPVDGRKFPHFAFVVDDSITGTGHIRTIHAASEKELEALTSKVPTEGGLKVIFKGQSERFHQAMKDYDYDLGINENYIDSALKRTGISAPYFAKTDAKALFSELLDWRKQQDAGLLRDMLEHRFAPEFAELRRQGNQYAMAAQSRTGYLPDILKAKQSNPYEDYIKTMLYVPREGTTPIWSAINRLAETSVSAATSKLQDTWKEMKSVEDLEKINTHLKEIGCNVYTDAATHALANHTAPAPVLSNWIRKANSILSFTMLRADPLNAVNNAFGHAVLYGSELPRLIKEISAAEGTATGQAMRDLTKVTVPGTPESIVSPAKIAAEAYGNWWKHIIGQEDGGVLYKRYQEMNLLPSYTDQMKSMVDNLTLRGTEAPADMHSMIHRAFEAANKIEKLTGNKFAEEMNRFVAADSARMVTDIAIQHGTLMPELQASVINTFVNRTQGIMLAAQRPLMFKGAVGQALGLFQTYQFNMMQQLFRYVGEGDRKTVATLLGLQGGIYGMNGLPAFNAMNQYMVGNAAGNLHHRDMISTTYDVAGKEMGDWLLYGASSNFLLHPDAKINLYSRGDINPRQITVIPTNLADVPVVGATTKFFGSIYEAAQKMDKGADKWSAFLQGVEHSGISRPLAGFAQALGAGNNPRRSVVSTDNAGNIVMENDLFSVMSAARLAGAKPLDEAVALDAFHRTQVYRLKDKANIENLGESIKATVVAGNVPTKEQINSFVSEYAKAGGNQRNFAEYYNRQVLNANRSKVNQMITNTANPFSTYMQRIMGGYELQDSMNTSAQFSSSNE